MASSSSFSEPQDLVVQRHRRVACGVDARALLKPAGTGRQLVQRLPGGLVVVAITGEHLHLLGRIGLVVHQRDVANQHRDLAGAVEHDLGLCGLGVVVERDVVQLVLDLRHLEQRGAAEDGQQCEQDAEAGKQAGADGMVLHEADHGISPE